ncbi:PLP-dependent transferase, partial [Candidatus Pacearchaeota archaeon]|nr:PLP-dependent transferase [Candidatus Pacearchaeota archaeon]
MNKHNALDLDSILVHGGEFPDSLTGAIVPSLVRTKTYKQPEFGKKARWEYARGQNPTRSNLEDKL